MPISTSVRKIQNTTCAPESTRYTESMISTQETTNRLHFIKLLVASVDFDAPGQVCTGKEWRKHKNKRAQRLAAAMCAVARECKLLARGE